MAKKHGVFVYEQATSLTPPVTATAAMPVFIGTAPVHRTPNPAGAVNKPLVCYSYAEAVETFGYSDDWDTWTLCEAMYSQLRLFGVAPVVFINVFDPSVGTVSVSGADIPVENGKAAIENELAVPDSIEVKASSTGSACVKGKDYTVALSGDGVTITPIPGGTLVGSTSLYIAYEVVDPSTVTSAKIVGGVDPATGKRTGIELIDEIFPKVRLVPGILAAPGWNSDNEVSIALTAKASTINGMFKSMAVVDVPESAGQSYRDVPLWKELSGLSSEFCIVCWPRIKMGTKVFHLSTQLAGLLGRTDYNNGDVPFASPSNQALKMDGMVWLGEEVWLDHQQASYLSAENGIVTALNWIGGWRAWGNRTATYPFSSDPKDAWIPVRRMFNWFTNEIILTYWSKVSLPIRKVLIDNIVNSLNIRLAGLTSAGYLLGGRVEWFASENPRTNLMDGKIQFHVYMTPPTPAETIDFWLEYDPDYFEMLAAALAT